MILLGLGSNLSSSFGDRFQNIELAISALETYNIKLKNKSSYYESLSYPNKKNPKFINIIADVSTDLPPVDLASVLIFIEESLERKRKKKNEPRTCDIDIIDYKGQIINFKYKDLDFIVPHIDLIYRNFVLYPIKEIIPDWKHPKTKEPINTLIDKLSKEDKNSILKVIKP
jgi:2-amino-4-hydroxy-6-hydroxymethyldihydropteridine diphosphokinase